MVKKKKAKGARAKRKPGTIKAGKRSPARKRTARRVIAKRAKGKKATVKKAAPRKPRSAAVREAEMALEKIGEVTHYFPHVKAAAVKLLKDGLAVGDKIYLKGHTTKFKEKVASIQLDRVPIREGRKGQEIGLAVRLRVRIGDDVYKITG